MAHPAAVAAVLVLVHLAAAALVFNPTPHSGGDNAAYLALARSLLDHGAYLQLWDPGAGQHAQYPPGFPAFLALLMAVGIGPWAPLKLVLVLVSAVGVGFSYLWMRARGEAGVALGAGVLVALAPGIVGNSHWILSDLPFWAATMATLWFAARDRPTATTIAAFVALTLRTAGLPLMLAVLAWLALRRRWRHAAVAAGTFLALAILWTLRASGSDVPYASELWLANPYTPDQGTVGIGGLLQRMIENGERYGLVLLPEVLASAEGPAIALFAGVFVAAAVVGWARRLGGRGVAEIFLPLYLGMILLWPGAWAADRFLLPILPILLLLAAEGVAVLPRSVRGTLRVGVAALVLLGAGVALHQQWRVARICREAAAEFPSPCLHPEVRAFIALADWTRNRLPEDAVALSRKPTFMYWFGGVPGRPYPFTLREGALFEEAEAAGARYLVVDRLGVVARTYLIPVIAQNPERFCAIHVIRYGRAQAVLLGILPAPREGWGRKRTEGGAVMLDMVVCPPEFTRP